MKLIFTSFVSLVLLISSASARYDDPDCNETKPCGSGFTCVYPYSNTKGYGYMAVGSCETNFEAEHTATLNEACGSATGMHCAEGLHCVHQEQHGTEICQIRPTGQSCSSQRPCPNGLTCVPPVDGSNGVCETDFAANHMSDDGEPCGTNGYTCLTGLECIFEGGTLIGKPGTCRKPVTRTNGGASKALSSSGTKSSETETATSGSATITRTQSLTSTTSPSKSTTSGTTASTTLPTFIPPIPTQTNYAPTGISSKLNFDASWVIYTFFLLAVPCFSVLLA